MRRPRRAIVVALVVVAAVLLAALLGREIAHLVKRLLEHILNLSGPALALTVGALAMLETAAFAGLAVPGELAVILGGVGASDGNASVQVMAAAASVGAVIGDSLGFLFGRKLGVRVLDGGVGRLMGRERVESTMARIRSGGIKAVVLGRFVGVLRAVMPFAAGASGLAYPRFLVASLLGATAWGVGFTLLGYAAGASWERVEGYVGQASKLLAVVIGVVVLVVWLAKKAADDESALRRGWARFQERPWVASVRRRYARQFGFLVARFRPGPAAGLQLTVSLLALAVLGALLAVVVDQALGRDGLFDLDEPVRRALADSRTEDAVAAMRAVRRALSPGGAWVAASVVGLALWAVDRRPRALVLLVGAVGGAVALAEVVQRLLERSRDLVSMDGLVTTSFPSTRMTVAAALGWALLATVLPRVRRWTWVVAIVAAMLVLVLLAGLAVLYLGQVYLSDVVGGLVLGALWGVAVTTAVATVWRLPRSDHDRAARTAQ